MFSHGQVRSPAGKHPVAGGRLLGKRRVACTLGEMPVFVLDCQTTGAHPERGHLLEVGWCLCRPGAPAEDYPVASHLVALPQPERIPGPIARLTGITAAQMQAAVSRRELWGLLCAALPGGDPLVTAVAHYARFEELFLRHLHAECEPVRPFPLRFVCTHEIARRLFPDLPRRGLHALAGYFGHSMPELKRAAAHVRAQIVVWNHLIELLRREQGVESLDELHVLVSGRAPRRATRWTYPLAREKRLALADRPGVYHFLNHRDEVLYVGKATSLYKRVNSYYRKRRGEEKLFELVTQARDVRVFETATALEAALLEVEQIRLHDPRYNRALRDTGQTVWFLRRDLGERVAAPDEQHDLGPWPAPEVGDALVCLSGLLSTRRPRWDDARRMARSLLLDARRIESRALLEALGLFRDEHCPGGDGRPSPGALLRLGAHLLSARVLVQERAAAAAGEEIPSGDDRRPLEPEEICRCLEDLLLQAARLRSRARWLLLLAEACVAWEAAGPGARQRLLTIVRGRIVAAEWIPEGSVLPAPPGATRRRMERLQCFDRQTYDRLRVLTTELRRVGHQGRRLSVCWAPHRRLEDAWLCSLLART